MARGSSRFTCGGRVELRGFGGCASRQGFRACSGGGWRGTHATSGEALGGAGLAGDMWQRPCAAPLTADAAPFWSGAARALPCQPVCRQCMTCAEYLTQEKRRPGPLRVVLSRHSARTARPPNLRRHAGQDWAAAGGRLLARRAGSHRRPLPETKHNPRPGAARRSPQTKSDKRQMLWCFPPRTRRPRRPRRHALERCLCRRNRRAWREAAAGSSAVWNAATPLAAFP